VFKSAVLAGAAATLATGTITQRRRARRPAAAPAVPTLTQGPRSPIANEIMPTLKQFRSVHWVKIYDRNGRTERSFGHSDSIPFSLKP
jgi:hypothetical protein